MALAGSTFKYSYIWLCIFTPANGVKLLILLNKLTDSLSVDVYKVLILLGFYFCDHKYKKRVWNTIPHVITNQGTPHQVWSQMKAFIADNMYPYTRVNRNSTLFRLKSMTYKKVALGGFTSLFWFALNNHIESDKLDSE